MNKDIKEIEDRLNDIIQKNEDAVKGYKKAAENADYVGLKSYFETKSSERKIFLTELKTAAPASKIWDEIDGSAAGALHRTWMDVKAFFSIDNDEAMLEEAIKGDKAAIDEYKEVLADTHLPVWAAAVIRKQRGRLKQNIEVNKTLEDLK